ncbi:MAG: hypothetical protein UDB11_06135 [Peptococcaceae bacterium]|nr:hypothetical protein [Peptococcaceae bacterium]
MAKKYKNKELRNAYLGSIAHTAKERTFTAVFLAIIAAGASVLLNALKNDEASDDEEVFRA